MFFFRIRTKIINYYYLVILLFYQKNNFVGDSYLFLIFNKNRKKIGGYEKLYKLGDNYI